MYSLLINVLVSQITMLCQITKIYCYMSAKSNTLVLLHWFDTLPVFCTGAIEPCHNAPTLQHTISLAFYYAKECAHYDSVRWCIWYIWTLGIFSNAYMVKLNYITEQSKYLSLIFNSEQISWNQWSLTKIKLVFLNLSQKSKIGKIGKVKKKFSDFSKWSPLPSECRGVCSGWACEGWRILHVIARICLWVGPGC